MKVGVLTYHRVVNDGSVLQAYCLQYLLRELLPEVRVELADYVPARLAARNRRALLPRRPPFVRPLEWRKQRAQRRFLAAHLQLSRDACVSDSAQAAMEFVAAQGYDAVVVGSDTVWELRDTFAAPPAPNAYWLPAPLGGARKASFAASADPVRSAERAGAPLRAALARHLDDFDFVSVRDGATRDLVLELGVPAGRVHFLPDPTLLRAFGELAGAPPPLPEGARPLAGVAVATEPLRSQACRALEACGYRVVNFLGSAPASAATLPGGETLAARLGVYPRLRALVTDRFHGSICALRLGPAAVVFVEDSAKWPQGRSKGRDLFERLGIGEMVWASSAGELTAAAVRGRLERWAAEPPDVEARVAALARAARPALDELAGVLRGEPARAAAEG